ncbi:MAG TPA: squalene--hopene cyclase [Actinobacteria bacterium]|nr:squalene--hopene cyclase [Actinomycetota bacterium]
MTMTQPRAAGEIRPAAQAAQAALERATSHLLTLQDERGWWQGELETNVTMDAEDLLLREFLGVRTAAQTEAGARWIRSRQRADGTWANSYGGPADLSTTVEAYVALRLAGDSPDAYHMAQAAGWIREAGGIPATRVFTRIWLALFGQWSWDDLPVMPAELIYLPSWFPLNVSDWACWARQTIVPLTIVGSLRPVRELPVRLDELTVTGRPPAVPARDQLWDRVFGELDRALHVYQRHGLRTRPLRAVHTAALRRCAEWIIARQEADGCWGGIQPPWVYSLIALHLLGYDLDHPVLRRGLAGLDSFTIWSDSPEGPVRRLEACQSPVWDTVLAMTALADAGLPADHPALVSAGQWVLDEEIRGPGDWQVRRPRLAPGGWAFEFQNDNYPDIDDTAEVILALRRSAISDGQAGQDAMARGIAWLVGMQSRDGGWGAFDADNCHYHLNHIPFADHGALLDPPTADVSARCVSMLAQLGDTPESSERLARGVDYLLAEQMADGSWFGRWGANYIYGAWSSLCALNAAGLPLEHDSFRRAVAWLVAIQNPDGGWGEDLSSYKLDYRGYEPAPSTASQTAWAALALMAAGELDHPALKRGVAYLQKTQAEHGLWDEARFTATGFPRVFYLRYHGYGKFFPLWALARYRNLLRANDRRVSVGL